MSSHLTEVALPGVTMKLRRAVLGDLTALVSLLADDPLGRERESPAEDDSLGAYQRAFRAIDADPAQLLVVAVVGDEVVGTVQLSCIPGLARRGALRGQLEAVRVRQDFRGHGLGLAMLTWVIAEAGRRGCALVQLTTDKSRTDAHRLYQRLGFVASHEGYKLALATVPG